MPNLSDPASQREHLIAAFEACCGALRSIEVAAVHLRQSDQTASERHLHLQRAAVQVQAAIAELRLAEGDSGLFPAGLVLPGEPDAPGPPGPSDAPGRGAPDSLGPAGASDTPGPSDAPGPGAPDSPRPADASGSAGPSEAS